jgi:hypothetical protein
MPNITTKAVVQSATFPDRGQAFIRDDSIEGFALRLTAKGAKSFVWEGRIKGRPRRITIGQFPDLSVAAARTRAHKIRAAIIEGRDPSEEHQTERREPIFADLIKAYFERHANKPSASEVYVMTNGALASTCRSLGGADVCPTSSAMRSRTFTRRSATSMDITPRITRSGFSDACSISRASGKCSVERIRLRAFGSLKKNVASDSCPPKNCNV